MGVEYIFPVNMDAEEFKKMVPKVKTRDDRKRSTLPNFLAINEAGTDPVLVRVDKRTNKVRGFARYKIGNERWLVDLIKEKFNLEQVAKGMMQR